MNYVYVSPHFPPNFYNFCVRLKEAGVNVLGLADEHYDNLRPELKWALKEYYRVENMHSYEQLISACGYFTHKYGKIDRIDSHNEYWLQTEANLRTDFNVFGVKNDQILDIKYKSRMKKKFIEAGVEVARG
ncbi:MAG TPA: carboxylate--amine ligase, partial [Candidatus Wallbacteria bacterium]|nr:carboxylate--amine ligase [Candidatus Wallbacteria bacterium]